MALKLLLFSACFLLLSVLSSFSVVETRTIKPTTKQPFTKILQSLEGVHNGQTVKGLSELKSFLENFGYMRNHSVNSLTGLADHFDENLESALKDYQRYHHLEVSGRLDAPTIKKMVLPRCGVPDIGKTNGALSIVANYSFFRGSPKWQDTKRDLTYTFRSSVNGRDMDDVRQACASAFGSWYSVTSFTFSEVDYGEPADIVLGFHRRDHGDGYPFDGPGRVLAHAFSPEDGRLHFDADESWSTSPGVHDIDVESVALHEIGHILGLGHSSDPNSIMFPTYHGVRRDLGQDDIDGISNLYGY